MAPPARAASAISTKVSARDAIVTGFAAQHGFTVHLVTMPGYQGPPAYASTDMRSCQVWVTPRTTRTLAVDVVRHEYLHVLACRVGTHFATPHFEHVADAGAALQGARHAFYGAFTRDDTLEARRLLTTAGSPVARRA